MVLRSASFCGGLVTGLAIPPCDAGDAGEAGGARKAAVGVGASMVIGDLDIANGFASPASSSAPLFASSAFACASASAAAFLRCLLLCSSGYVPSGGVSPLIWHRRNVSAAEAPVPGGNFLAAFSAWASSSGSRSPVSIGLMIIATIRWNSSLMSYRQ